MCISLSSCHEWPPVITWRILAPAVKASLSSDTSSKTKLTGGLVSRRIVCNFCTWSPHRHTGWELGLAPKHESHRESVPFSQRPSNMVILKSLTFSLYQSVKLCTNSATCTKCLNTHCFKIAHGHRSKYLKSRQPKGFKRGHTHKKKSQMWDKAFSTSKSWNM